MCRLEDGVVYSSFPSILMSPEDPVLERFTEIFNRFFETDLYNSWISMFMRLIKVVSSKVATGQPVAGYYSFNLYHMQPAFYLLLMGWCLGAFSLMLEVLYNCLLIKVRKRLLQ
jgi:H+/Cl- antiporter ClcA